MSGFNSWFQSSPSPKQKFKKKLKFNDSSSLLQDTRKNWNFSNSRDSSDDKTTLGHSTCSFDWGTIKSEIDIDEHMLPPIKQEPDTDSNPLPSPKIKKKKHKEHKNDGLHQNKIDGYLTANVKKEHQTNTFDEFKKPRTYSESDSQNEESLNRNKEKNENKKPRTYSELDSQNEEHSSRSKEKNEFKKPRTYSESDSQNEEYLNRNKGKKKRKKDKNNALHEDLGTETDSSTTSQKHKKKKKHKESNNEEDSALDSVSTNEKKNKSDDHESINKKFNGLNKTKNTLNLDDQNRNEMKHNEEKTIDSESPLIDPSPNKIKKKKRQVRITLQLTFIPETNVQNEVDFDHYPNQKDEIQNLANEENEAKLDDQLIEDNVENPKVQMKKKKKKKKKMKQKGNSENETISEMTIAEKETDLDKDSLENKETERDERLEKMQNNEETGLDADSLENNEIGPGEPEETISNDELELEEKNDNSENKSMDQDNEIETASKTSPINAPNLDIVTKDNKNNKRGKAKMKTDENFFEMNSSSSEEMSDSQPLKKNKCKLFDKFRTNPDQIKNLKKKVNIISNELLNKSPVDKSRKKRRNSISLFAKRFEDYSSNDEGESLFEPQVDHNTTLEDVLEKSREDNNSYQDFIEKCGNYLKVKSPPDVQKIHMIESAISLISDKEKDTMKNLGIKLKKGPFSKKDDEILQANWKSFCEEHDVPVNPAPFVDFKFLKKIMTVEDRLNFVRHLAKDLNDRTLHSVYNRFCTLIKTKRRGRFTPEEDRVILDYITKTEDKCPYATLAKILNRSRILIQKRVKKLTNNCDDKLIKWSKDILEDIVKNLLKVTGIKDVEVFRERPILLKDWKRISEIMNIPALKLKYAWENRIYRELFYAYDEISTADIRKKIIEKLFEMNITDFRTINWIEFAKEFDGLSSANIYKYFYTILRYHVPKNFYNQPTECLEYLKNEFLPNYQFVDKKIKKVYLNI